jgi:hypothetical protein
MQSSVIVVFIIISGPDLRARYKVLTFTRKRVTFVDNTDL